MERVRASLPPSWVIVCHFYDVESGRKEIDQRGHGADTTRFDIPIPRDGGLDDLLAEAARLDRRFDVVFCESMSRIARRMYEGLTVERALDKAQTPLLGVNEPIKLDGGRAQLILQRRINQSVAEYQVMETLETSWGGLCTHVRDGYNIGKPPHGIQGQDRAAPEPGQGRPGGNQDAA